FDRTRTTHGREGYALVTAMLLTVIVAGVVAASLRYTGTEMRLTRDSSVRIQAIHAAEAGVELALAAFDSSLTDANSWSDWTAAGAGTFTLSSESLAEAPLAAGNADFFVTANTNTLVVTSTGTCFSATLNDMLSRSVQIELDQDVHHPYEFGLLGKDHVKMTGNSFMDSFDSSDPAKSTGGLYDPSKAQGNITVATMSTDPSSAIHGAGNSTVRGDLQTAAGGGLQSGGNFAYTGTLSHDLDVDFSDVTVPWTLSPPFSTSLSIKNKKTSQTISLSGDTDLEYGSIQVSGGSLTITGSGRLRIYVDGSTHVSGQGEIVIDNSAPGNDIQVELYVNGHTQFTGLVLGSQIASDLAILGTPNCTHIQYAGKSDYVGTVYAPQANFHVSGQGGMVGAAVGKEIHMTGQGDFHYDEHLGTITSGDAGDYDLISWIEL
ncbi:MAG: hypothetical protein HN341_12745, partial [Verrucomicrobia bacterium]|nr:hypothetical protein [Verrucomicrobiota bacterium]